MEEPVSTAISNMREDTREYKAAKALEAALNDIGWSPVKFAESVTTFHRTLQQTLMRTIVEVIKKCGSEEYGTDLRNRATKALCKDIISTGVLENNPLPYV